MVSEGDRERALDRLRSGYVAGAIGSDTLERRVQTVLATDCPVGLEHAVRDLPARRTRTARRSASGYRLLCSLAGGRALTIGRAPDCELVLADDAVSRRHASLAWDGDVLLITDLASTNGTYVNGHRVTCVALHPGDRVQLGETRLAL